MSLPKLCVVGDVVEYERFVERKLPFHGQLRNTPPGCSEPTLSH
jgi:hypothetical protein